MSSSTPGDAVDGCTEKGDAGPEDSLKPTTRALWLVDSVESADAPLNTGSDDFAVIESILQRRRSCRGFKATPVPRDVIGNLLAAAQRTPSWSNMQPWQVSIVSGVALQRLRSALAAAQTPAAPDFPFPEHYDGVYKERRRASGWQLYDAVGVKRGDRAGSAVQARRNYEFFDAPHVALITTEKSLGTYGAIDCGLYIQSFLLAAEALGLGAVAQAALAVRADFLRTWLGLRPERLVVCGISFGFADPAHPSASVVTDRADLTQVATFID
ncbi:nitroreductase [Streptomyces malaysiensis]|uniref:nitroreductase n=1 Tax=Streptomyces malaysiensis TaxID=92644 RepID=UPI002B282DD3|nr:nitroreductase [Streptomyces malaysiensis]